MSEVYVVRCLCGQAERQRSASLIARDPSNPPIAAHTTSCPVTLLEAWKQADAEVERLLVQPAMFEDDARVRSVEAVMAHRDRLAKRLDDHVKVGEPGSLPSGVLWYEYPSKLHPGSKPARVTLRGDGA